MPLELKVPEVGESITEVQIGKWHKSVGEHVEKDEPVVEIESDKATIDLPAPVAGTLSKMVKKQGDQAAVGEVIGYLAAARRSRCRRKPENGAASIRSGQSSRRRPPSRRSPSKRSGARPLSDRFNRLPVAVRKTSTRTTARVRSSCRPPTSARRARLSADQVKATGPGGRMLQEDVERAAAAATERRRPPANASRRRPHLPRDLRRLTVCRASSAKPHARAAEDEREDEFVVDESRSAAASPSGWSRPSKRPPCSRRSTKST